MKISNSKISWLVAVIGPVFGLILLLVILWWLAYGRSSTATMASNQASVVEQVRRLAVVPPEEPQVQTLDNPGTIQGQIFAEQAVAGDYLLIYPQGGKQVLFRPSINKVIYLGDLPASQRPTRVDVEIRNGSHSLGAAATLSKVLEANQLLSILDINQADHNDYQGNFIVNLCSTCAPDLLAQLTKQLSASVTTTMPTGEASSRANWLLIIGNTTTTISN
jgi:hypothetical protein